MVRILVTGSRDWVDEGTVEEAIHWAGSDASGEWLPDVTVVHGACPTGADAIADRYARQIGLTVEPHPADWRTLRKAAGPLRNQAMVDLGADVCLAFPLVGSRGTYDCLARARAAGIEVIVYDHFRSDY